MHTKVNMPPSPLYKNWERFTQTGKPEKPSKSPIHKSWKRCLDMNLNPTGMNISRRLSDSDINQLFLKNQMLFDASNQSLSILENSIRDIPYAVLLCNSKGDILYNSGNGVVLDRFEEANLVIGGNCSEGEIGTTAPGIVIVEKQPIIVLHEEHYSQIYHWCCCSAFPIFDIEKVLIGCINVTFLNDQADKMNLLQGLNLATVKSIESSFHIQQLINKIGTKTDLIESIQNVYNKNMIITDKRGKILLSNQEASNLLNVPICNLTGEHYQNFMKSDAIVSCLSMQTKHQGLVQFKNRHPLDKEYYAEARPLHNQEGNFIGGAIILHEKKKNWQGAHCGLAINFTFDVLVGDSPGIRRAAKLACRFAGTDMPILIHGDTGTGKEVFAHAIHNHSKRKDNPFIPVNCAAIPYDLLESELFGYSRGAFTGASCSGKKGKFEIAEGGTLFLDELNSMPIEAQGKLLRAVENGEIVQLGNNKYKHIDVRIIAASSVNLEDEFLKGRFRKDLYYRLSLVTISLPNLKERMEDLKVLVQYFLKKYMVQQSIKPLEIHPSALEALHAHDWPGNVRELENCLKFAIHLADSDIIMPEHLPDYLGRNNFQENTATAPNSLMELDKSLILNALVSSNGNIGKAAAKLGISRSTIYRKRKQYGML